MTYDISTVWLTCQTLVKSINDEILNSEVDYLSSTLSKISPGLEKKINVEESKKEGKLVIDEADSPEDNEKIIAAVDETYKKDFLPDNSEVATLRNMFDRLYNFIQTYLCSQGNILMFSYMMSDMKIEINFKQRGFVDVDISSYPLVMRFNPLFIASDWSINQVIGSMLLESIRIFYLHPSTYIKENPNSDNITHEQLEKGSDMSASSILINKIISDFTNSGNTSIEVPPNTYTETEFEKETGKNVKPFSDIEYYYAIYRATHPQPPTIHLPCSIGMPDKNVASPANKKGDQIHNWEKTDEDIASTNMINNISSAANSLDSSRGTMPLYIKERLDKIFKPAKINWRNVLKRTLGIIPVPYRSTRTRLNRRQPTRPDLFGRLPRHISRIIVALDTSGSMSASALTNCLSEVINIVKESDTEITVIECDSEIGKIYKIHPKKTYEIQKDITGLGGTSYIPTINYINKNNYKDAILIYFTDGYGNKKIPRPKTFRNIWVVLDDAKNLSLENPYGSVVTLYKDDPVRR